MRRYAAGPLPSHLNRDPAHRGSLLQRTAGSRSEAGTTVPSGSMTSGDHDLSQKTETAIQPGFPVRDFIRLTGRELRCREFQLDDQFSFVDLTPNIRLPGMRWQSPAV